MYLKLARIHCMLWYIQHATWMLLAVKLGIGSWYDAAEFARNKGIHTPASRRWVADPPWVRDEPSETQADYNRLVHLMDGDPDAPLLHINHTNANQCNKGIHAGEFNQFDRMLFEDHKFVKRRGGKQLVRLQLPKHARIAWYQDPQQVAARIGTSTLYGKRFVDAFKELGTSSHVAYQLCKQASLDPDVVANHLEILASELHKLSLDTDERLEFGFNCDLVVALN